MFGWIYEREIVNFAHKNTASMLSHFHDLQHVVAANRRHIEIQWNEGPRTAPYMVSTVRTSAIVLRRDIFFRYFCRCPKTEALSRPENDITNDEAQMEALEVRHH